jgi:uncharacterized protein
MWKSIALALALAVGAGNALAQTKKELVAKLLQVQQPGIENIGRALASQPSQRALQAAGQAMQRVPADKREALGKEIQADVKKFYDDIEPLLRKRATELAPASLAPVYEEKFSEDELKTVIAWLESPVSKKFQQIDSEIAATLAQKVVTDTRGTVEPKLKALEVTLAKRLGISPPPAIGASGSASAPKK